MRMLEHFGSIKLGMSYGHADFRPYGEKTRGKRRCIWRREVRTAISLGSLWKKRCLMGAMKMAQLRSIALFMRIDPQMSKSSFSNECQTSEE